MDLDRPHFRTTSTGSTTNELFICFTSRLSSSSSMRLTKSILSPGRAARDGAGPVTLSSSLSRRLRTNGSLKGGQASPFFPTTGKKRGCAFENPEPSSPKVTCIGQVRVKTKKKVKQSRSLSKRRSGEVSFRKIEQTEPNVNVNTNAQYQQQQECLQQRNQRWVHLPISICEALRSFGSEFSCLFPCKSSCFSTTASEREKGEKGDGSSGCGAVFARWLVSVNDDGEGGGGKRGEIELVVGGDDEEEERVSMRSSRRHVFEDIEVKDDRIELKGQSVELEQEVETEDARVSICIPPKNALLLMRCRSDPMKMAALANRFSWDAHSAPKFENLASQEQLQEGENEAVELDVVAVSEESNQEDQQIPDEEKDSNLEIELVEEKLVMSSTSDESLVEEEEEELEEVESNMSSFEELLEQENAEHYQDCPIQENEELQDIPICHLSPSPESDVESNEPLPLLEPATDESNTSEIDTTILTNIIHENDQATPDPKLESESESESESILQEDETGEVEQEMEKPETEVIVMTSNQEPKKEKVLPECLLLMMCEPKLSMEVSKETWVCSTDFIRWLPERPRGKPPKPTGSDHEPAVKRRLSIDSNSKPKPTDNNEQHQPPRSSCTLPVAAAAASMATMIEQKLVNAVAYEPFVLTRCKSEPMRTAAAKLMPESCFWKNAMRKLEPHRRTTLGVGAAGVGF